MLPQDKAASASTFTASIGVNTHLDQVWTSYGDTAMAVGAIEYLGVGKLRDSMAGTGDAALFTSVAAAANVEFDVYLSLSAVDYDAQIAAMRSVAGILAAVEGINEGDTGLSNIAYRGQTGYAAIAAAQGALYDAFKADPATSTITVIGPSYGITADFAFASNTAAVSDAGNTHQYAGTGNPPLGAIPAFLAQAATVSDNRPVIATEAGYYTGSSRAGAIAAYQHSGVSELVQAKYDLTMLFDDWKARIQSTYLFELLDPVADPGNTDSEFHFGIFNADGSPKLAAIALHDLLAMLADSGPARTDTFGYQISGAPGTGNSLLLEKSNGIFDLAIWNDIRLSDAITATDSVNPPVPITIGFGQTVRSVVEYDPLLGTGIAQSWSDISSISLDLPDHPVLLAIAPYPAAPLSLTSFVLPQTIAPHHSSGNLWAALIANAVENDPGWLAGIAVVAVQTGGTTGSVNFYPGTQTVSYLAPAYAPLKLTDSFTYTIADTHGNTVTGTVAFTETAPANAVYDIVPGARIDTPASGWTIASAAAGQSLYGGVYTGVTFLGSADTQMYGGADSTMTAGDGTHSLGAGDNARITLGNGNNVIGLVGSGNTVVTGDGDNLVWKPTGNTSITMGKGNQSITAGGRDNVISVGVGASTIYVGADGAPDGNESITVGGGYASITAGGVGDTVHVLGGAGNTIVGLSASATLTVDAGSTTVVAQGADSTITILSGSNTVQASGDNDTITLGNGGTFVWASGNGDRFTTGPGYALIDFLGQQDIVDATRGEAVLIEQGSRNTIVLAAADGISTQIYGDVIAAADTLDLRRALAATTWNGRQDTLPDYLQVGNPGGASAIAIDADGQGAGPAATIAVLHSSAGLTFPGLLAHAILA